MVPAIRYPGPNDTFRYRAVFRPRRDEGLYRASGKNNPRPLHCNYPITLTSIGGKKGTYHRTMTAFVVSQRTNTDANANANGHVHVCRRARSWCTALSVTSTPSRSPPRSQRTATVSPLSTSTRYDPRRAPTVCLQRGSSCRHCRREPITRCCPHARAVCWSFCVLRLQCNVSFIDIIPSAVGRPYPHTAVARFAGTPGDRVHEPGQAGVR